MIQRTHPNPTLYRLAIPVVAALILVFSMPASTSETLNGMWVLNKKRSDDLQDVMEEIRRDQQDEIDQIEESNKRKKQKPGIFGKTGSWDDRRAEGATATIPRIMRDLISAEHIKIYFSRKLAISYGSEIKRLLTPNPYGRVYSASGAGLSNDRIGESLSYVQEGKLYIETRTNVGKLKEKFDPVTEPGNLIVTWGITAPAIDRPVEMITVYKKQ